MSEHLRQEILGPSQVALFLYNGITKGRESALLSEEYIDLTKCASRNFYSTLLLFDPVLFQLYEERLLIGSILNFEALLGVPLIKQLSTYCIYLYRCVF